MYAGKGFTLVELLVIISVIGILSAILLPCLSLAREKTMVAAANVELYHIGTVLEMYFQDHKKFPPTQNDCSLGLITKHLYQLPKVLATEDYLPPGRRDAFTNMEDRFNPGYTYKYRSVGEAIIDRDIVDEWIKISLWVPDGFPEKSSINPNEGHRYNDIAISPVRWVVFSLGPRFSMEWLENKLGSNYFDNYPVAKELWYRAEERRGFIVLMQLSDGSYQGSFKK